MARRREPVSETGEQVMPPLPGPQPLTKIHGSARFVFEVTACWRRRSCLIRRLNAHVPANILSNLHGFRFLGNDAVHQLSAPAKEDLAEAIEVMEDVMNVVYDLDYASSRLYRRFAPKQGKAPPK